MVEPLSIEDAAISPTRIKQIQADQTELRKHMHKWETAEEVYCNLTQEVGEDAFGPNKYIWTLAQRRLVASVFIEGARYRQANHYLL